MKNVNKKSRDVLLHQNIDQTYPLYDMTIFKHRICLIIEPIDVKHFL